MFPHLTTSLTYSPNCFLVTNTTVSSWHSILNDLEPSSAHGGVLKYAWNGLRVSCFSIFTNTQPVLCTYVLSCLLDTFFQLPTFLFFHLVTYSYLPLSFFIIYSLLYHSTYSQLFYCTRLRVSLIHILFLFIYLLLGIIVNLTTLVYSAGFQTHCCALGIALIFSFAHEFQYRKKHENIIITHLTQLHYANSSYAPLT